MFYKMITTKRDQWLISNECPIKGIVSYIESIGFLRDAQLDAIKTYLFLKVFCECRPLPELFCNGVFNNLNLDEIELS